MSKSFYTGFEEMVSRFVSLVLSLSFFSIYILAKSTDLLLDWNKLTIHLLVFWFVYEVLSYILFIIFCQFSKNKVISSDVKATPKSPFSSPLLNDNLDKKPQDTQK